MFRFSDLIIFEVTRDCNINCKYCYVLDKYKFKGEVMDFDLYKKIINRIAEQRIVNGLHNETLHFNFHGGEALLVGKDFFKKCVDYLKTVFAKNGLNLHVGIQTNGTLLDDEWFEIFRYYNIPVGLSFDSFLEKDPLRFSSQTKKKIEDYIRKAQEEDIIIGLLSVYSKKTKKNIDKDNKYITDNNLTVGRKVNFIEDTKNPYNSKYEVSGKDIFKYFLKKELDFFLKTGILKEHHTRGLLTDCILDIITMHTSHYKSGCNGLICGAGIQMLAVRPDGTMGYCDRYSMDIPENYIEHCLDYDFLGLHQLKKVMELDVVKHEALKKTGCDHCRARFICEGGCSAFFYSKFGYYGIQKNLVCDQFKSFYDYVKKNLIKFLNKIYENNVQALQNKDAMARDQAMIRLTNPPGTSFISFKDDVVDFLHEEGFDFKKLGSNDSFEIKVFKPVHHLPI